MREEIVIVVSAPPGSPVAHTYPDLGSAIRDSFPATVGRGGGWGRHDKGKLQVEGRDGHEAEQGAVRDKDSRTRVRDSAGETRTIGGRETGNIGRDQT